MAETRVSGFILQGSTREFNWRFYVREDFAQYKLQFVPAQKRKRKPCSSLPKGCGTRRAMIYFNLKIPGAMRFPLVFIFIMTILCDKLKLFIHNAKERRS